MTILSRKFVLGCGAAFAALSLATAAEAQVRSFNVPAQDAVKAIPEFARQAGVQIVAPASQLRGVRTPPVQGQLDARAALRQLIAGTGLEIAGDTGSVITLRRARNPPDERAQPLVDAEPRTLSELIVTGTNIRGADGVGVAPVVTLDHQLVENTGAGTISAVLDYLPQATFSFDEQSAFAGSQIIQLRGLGIGTTLVLVNGRRTTSSGLQGARGYFDVNTIPSAAVDRLEVLASSASAIYGADAIGGVVNIILRDHVPRPVLDLSYGFTPEGGHREKRVSFTAGLGTEVLRANVVLDAVEIDPLRGRDRDLFANVDFRRFGGLDNRSTASNPGNVFSSNGQPLPGLSVTSAGIPAGSSGVGLRPSDFAATAGVLNYFHGAAVSDLIPAAERYSAFITGEADLGGTTQAFGELLLTSSDYARRRAPPSVANLPVSATAPNNPFGAPVLVSYRFTDLGLTEDRAQSFTVRTVAGLRGDIGAWDWELSYLGSFDRGETYTTNQLVRSRVQAAVQSGQLNLFRSSGPPGSPEVLQSLLLAPPLNRAGADMHQGSVLVRGPLFQLPAGALQAAIGGEVRTESLDLQLVEFGLSLAPSRRTEAAFAELLAPVISEEMAVPGVLRLSATLAGRYDRYSDFGGVFSPQVGLQWEVVEGFTARASYARSFRAPSLFELYSPQSRIAEFQITDRRRGNEAYAVEFLGGGNPNLSPEEAETFNVGLVFRPTRRPTLQANIDGWRIEQGLRVIRVSPSQILDNEALFPDLVIRGAPTAADVAANRPGRIVFLDNTSLNFGGIETQGIDVAVSDSWRTEAGAWSARVAATYVASFKSALIPGQAPIERVGRYSTEGTVPRWRAAATLNWSGDRLGAFLGVRYVGAYREIPATPAADGKMPAQVSVDAQVSAQLGSVWASPLVDGTTVRLGVNNLFDVEPPFVSSSGQGYDPSLADVRQRFVYIKLSRTF